MKPEIVNIREHPMDTRTYVYGICECTSRSEAIRIKREKESGWASFACPRCGTKLCISVLGTEDPMFRFYYGGDC